MRQVEVRRFQVMEPSLQQIFLEAVGVVGEERKQLSALVQ